MTTIDNMNDLRAAINQVLDYSWSDEEEDYKEHGGEDGDTENHIYRTLLALDKWVNGD